MKGKRIKLKWVKRENIYEYNFGDDLSPYIIHKLSGLEITYIHFANTRFNITHEFLSGIFHGKISYKFIQMFVKSILTKKYIISVGSIIQLYGSSRCLVWGSGIINRNDKINKSEFLAVRGKYTKERIKLLGYNEPLVLGDPALLLPLLYTPVITRKYRLGIIPHYIHYNEIKSLSLSSEILIIKLDNQNLETVINDINSCDFTISTSLHGIIVSHAYNIKSLWFKFQDIKLCGDNVKFLDYFSSVNIAEYEPLEFLLNEKIDINETIEIIVKNDNINHINGDIKQIQKQLIDIAPFPIKVEFSSKTL